MDYSDIKLQDEEVFGFIKDEEDRQRKGLELIPSENYASPAVMQAMGSVLTNKYSEGYAKKRYYGGNQFIDEIELLAVNRAKELFGVPQANVQPYSGSPANFAVLMAACRPGETIMGLNLPDGGHLTHGWKVSASAIFFKSVPYHVKEDGRIDFDEIWQLAKEHKPKLIWAGATAYPYKYEYDKFADIADSVGAFLAADIAHVAGLIVGGVHPSPVPHAHIVTTTTHKTLRGPRGGIIMVTEKGLAKDAELGEKIDKAVFPGLQGGPHDHQTAAIAIALKEAAGPEFKRYAAQVVTNARALAQSLLKNGVSLVSGGTENHLLLLDLVPQLGPGGGVFVQEALDEAHITANKNTIPKDPSSPFYPSGLRAGTPALTSRGMKEQEMEMVGELVARVIKACASYRLPGKDERNDYLATFRREIKQSADIKAVGEEVLNLSKNFPVPGINS